MIWLRGDLRFLAAFRVYVKVPYKWWISAYSSGLGECKTSRPRNSGEERLTAPARDGQLRSISAIHKDIEPAREDFMQETKP